MTQEQRESYRNLLKELKGGNDNPAKQLLQLALDLDEKGEFWKFIEVFVNPRAFNGSEYNNKY